MNTGMITTPSGRQFSFPDIRRLTNGNVTNFTQIKNYPVQSFATADIVPLVLMHMEDKFKTYKSCIVNSVHDSVVVDVHPEEINQVIYLIKEINNELKPLIESKFGINLNVPLLLEAKIGDNWLDTKDVA